MNQTDRDNRIKDYEEQLVREKAEWQAIHDAYIDSDMLDEDGYPTDTALDLIAKWHWSDEKGWFDFINSIWHLKSWGWHEGEEPHEWYEDKKCYRYNISTAGWSGNEAIIHAMKQNDFAWHLVWVQSRRGGHYIFELRNYGDE